MNTTGKPVSAHMLTPTHRDNTQTTRDGAFSGSTRAFHEAETASQSMRRTTIENEGRGEELGSQSDITSSSTEHTPFHPSSPSLL